MLKLNAKSLTYWIARCRDGDTRSHLRAFDEKDCNRMVRERGGRACYEKPYEVTVQYYSPFDLLDDCMSGEINEDRDEADEEAPYMGEGDSKDDDDVIDHDVGGGERADYEEAQLNIRSGLEPDEEGIPDGVRVQMQRIINQNGGVQ